VYNSQRRRYHVNVEVRSLVDRLLRLVDSVASGLVACTTGVPGAYGTSAMDLRAWRGLEPLRYTGITIGDARSMDQTLLVRSVVDLLTIA